jgi:hypothetical protein
MKSSVLDKIKADFNIDKRDRCHGQREILVPSYGLIS